MTLVKNRKTGNWEGDFRPSKAAEAAGMKRLHLSFGTPRKSEAMTAHEAVAQLIKEGHWDLIERLRRGEIEVETVRRLRNDNVAFATLRPAEGTGAEDGAWPTVADAVTQYGAHLEATKEGRGTAPTAKSQLTHFVAYVGGDTPIDRVTFARFGDYQAHLVAKGYAPNTLTAYVARVAALYRFLQKREARAARDERRVPRPLYSPVDPETQPTGRTVRERFLSDEEVNLLFAATPEALAFPVAAGVLAGLRLSEMLTLRPPPFDLNLEQGYLVVQEKQLPDGTRWRPKSGKRRFVDLSSDLAAIAERHLARYASATWLLPSVGNPARPMHDNVFEERFQRVVSDAKLAWGRRRTDGVTFHTLRHTFASHLVMRGVDPYTVSKLLGNTVRMVESTYGHLAPKHRQRAVEQLAGAFTLPALAAAAPPVQPRPSALVAPVTINADREGIPAGVPQQEQPIHPTDSEEATHAP